VPAEKQKLKEYIKAAITKDDADDISKMEKMVTNLAKKILEMAKETYKIKKDKKI